MNLINFQPRKILEYPPTNNYLFEEYFFDNYNKININHNLEYLPIFWTNYYIKNNFGQNNLNELQEYLNLLDKSKKYFTIVQYDDNILNDLLGLDIVIFAQGGYGNYKNITYPIPLNYMVTKNSNTKDIFSSFIGTINKRHRIREKLFEILKNKKEYFISESTKYNHFKDIMSRSIFSLCPRGYGPTSFRICEALQNESIPVYIFDEPFIPFSKEFNFSDIGILIHESEINNIDKILKSKTTSEINKMIDNGKTIYDTFFTYEGCFNNIIKILEKYD
jgi:hypothetical protein